MNQKAERLTVTEEQQIQAKKDKFPSANTYKIEWKRIDKEKRITGNYTFDEHRSGYLEEIEYMAKLEPPCKMHDKNYKWVDVKPKAAMIYKPSPERTPPKDNVSPTSYDIDPAFKKSQLGQFTSYSFGKQKIERQVWDFKERTSHLS